jgi:hypothetical protein
LSEVVLSELEKVSNLSPVVRKQIMEEQGKISERNKLLSEISFLGGEASSLIHETVSEILNDTTQTISNEELVTFLKLIVDYLSLKNS